MQAVMTEQLGKTYDTGATTVHALAGVNLAIAKGEFVTVMGPSGSGKSTLLALLGGLERPTEGKVTVDNTAIGAQSETQLAQMRRGKVGFVFQAFNLVPVLSAIENVELPLILAGRRVREVRSRATSLLDRVGLQGRHKHYPAELSGGQQQRVAIARALVAKPSIVLADEPTGNLDSRSSYDVMSLLRETCDELKQTIVLITHDANVAAWGDRVLFLQDGAVVADERLNGSLLARSQRIQRDWNEVMRHG